MNRSSITLFAGMLALIWSLPSVAHSSLEALQNGGSVLKITAELLHPLVEHPYALAVGAVILLVVMFLPQVQKRVKARNLQLSRSSQI